MDSITQALLGASVAASIAPKQSRKKAFFYGAVLGTLPDLDVLIKYSSGIDNFTSHRGFSHSLLLLPIFSLLLLPIFKKIFTQLSNIRLYLLIMLSLITHPILDSFTSYGTQLFYPFDFTPTYIASVFIIDPLYTSWLLLGIVLYFIWQNLKWFNTLTLAISSLYLVFGVYMQSLAKDNLVKSYPYTKKQNWYLGVMTGSPFCWRGIYISRNTYIESAFNILNPKDKIEATYSILDSSKYPNSKDIDRLLWFNPNTVFREDGNKLISSDLRMGEFGTYVFEFFISPDNIAGTKLEKNTIFWTPITSNRAFKQYILTNQNISYPKQKLTQFLQCLKGKY